MNKRKLSAGSFIKWTIALVLVVIQVYPFFYVFTSGFKSLEDFSEASGICAAFTLGYNELY